MIYIKIFKIKIEIKNNNNFNIYKPICISAKNVKTCIILK